MALYNCSQSISNNNTCNDLIIYCKTEYTRISDICRCLSNTKLYSSKCNDDIYSTQIVIIVVSIIFVFMCGFIYLCFFNIYNKLKRDRLNRDRLNRHNHQSTNLINYNNTTIPINEINNPPPDYDEISNNDISTTDNYQNQLPPPYNV